MLVVFSGRTASGKSTLAKAVASALNGKAASFGGYIRHLAVARGMDPDDRLTLQDLGQNLVEADPQAFTTSFLSFAKYTPETVIVVDGLRHLSVLECLKATIQPPDRFVLIYVEISDPVRYERLVARGVPEADIADIEKHRSETDVLEGLANAANMIVDGNVPVDRQTDIITAAIG